MGRIRPETVDAVDVGLRYQTGDLTIAPTFFGFWTHKKEVLVFDPAVGQSYYQSNAATVGRGFELETSWKATDWLTLTGSATIAAETYVANIAAGSSSMMQIGGKQTPYTPRYRPSSRRPIIATASRSRPSSASTARATDSRTIRKRQPLRARRHQRLL